MCLSHRPPPDGEWGEKGRSHYVTVSLKKANKTGPHPSSLPSPTQRQLFCSPTSVHGRIILTVPQVHLKPDHLSGVSLLLCNTCLTDTASHITWGPVQNEKEGPLLSTGTVHSTGHSLMKPATPSLSSLAKRVPTPSTDPCRTPVSCGKQPSASKELGPLGQGCGSLASLAGNGPDHPSIAPQCEDTPVLPSIMGSPLTDGRTTWRAPGDGFCQSHCCLNLGQDVGPGRHGAGPPNRSLTRGNVPHA